MSRQQNRSLGQWADDDRNKTTWDSGTMMTVAVDYLIAKTKNFHSVVAGYNGDNSATMAMGDDKTLGDDETLYDGGEYWYEASLMTIGIASLDFGGWSDRWVWRQKYREGIFERLKGGVDIWTGLLSNGAERFGRGMNPEGGYIGV
ncbi:hypothetical protein F0562_006435 [Nyssa sinensis]|uniref:Uncharacterized protein n=1 Tax=Nyssa sinensis TaxID=561372 RepID=A0A5J5ANP0_9ASTE|nr:hypothetical protein F0562_006435 [Nyssa sinensis]